MEPRRKFVARFRSVDRSPGIGNEFAFRVMDRDHDAIMHRSLAREKSNAESFRNFFRDSPLRKIRMSAIDVLQIEGEWLVRFTLPHYVVFFRNHDRLRF